MEKLYTIKLTVISIICLIFIINSVHAEQFDFSFTNISNINEKIDVNIINFNFSDSYDIKIYIHNSTDSEIKRSEVISKTFNDDTWKDSWNYLYSALPKNTEFKIKLESYSENPIICVKIRKTNNSQVEELCKPTNFTLDKADNSKTFKSSDILSTKLYNLRLFIALFSFILILLILIIIALDI